MGKGFLNRSTEEGWLSPFRRYGLIGILMILVAQTLAIFQVRLIAVFLTPIMWTGYILFVDAVVFKLRGDSFIQSRRRQFLVMLPLSFACWMIFELYNLHLQNWHYVTSESVAIQWVIACWAFATIFPGVLETSELIDAVLPFPRGKPVNTRDVGRRKLCAYIGVGVVFLVLPLVVPAGTAKFLFGLVWVGFVFLLDPLNHVLGVRSLFGELENGRIDKVLSLFLSGIICGFLWEFWNYWAATRWVYTLPFPQTPRIFEMPLIGFLGFLPFAVECYVMYHFLLFVLNGATTRLGLTIGPTAASG